MSSPERERLERELAEATRRSTMWTVLLHHATASRAGLNVTDAQAINALDILVHASVQPEPFGRVVAEAMGCGVPVVASASGGILEVVRDGETGLLVKPGDVGGLTEAVETLLGDEPLRKELAEQGRREFLERFTDQRHLDGMIRLYDLIASE